MHFLIGSSFTWYGLKRNSRALWLSVVCLAAFYKNTKMHLKLFFFFGLWELIHLNEASFHYIPSNSLPARNPFILTGCQMCIV